MSAAVVMSCRARLLFAIALFLAPSASASVQSPPPHLIYILADDYGWANVGFHSADMITPNIDRLAKTEGFELRRMYAYRFSYSCIPD